MAKPRKTKPRSKKRAAPKPRPKPKAKPRAKKRPAAKPRAKPRAKPKAKPRAKPKAKPRAKPAGGRTRTSGARPQVLTVPSGTLIEMGTGRRFVMVATVDKDAAKERGGTLSTTGTLAVIPVVSAGRGAYRVPDAGTIDLFTVDAQAPVTAQMRADRERFDGFMGLDADQLKTGGAVWKCDLRNRRPAGLLGFRAGALDSSLRGDLHLVVADLVQAKSFGYGTVRTRGSADEGGEGSYHYKGWWIRD